MLFSVCVVQPSADAVPVAWQRVLRILYGRQRTLAQACIVGHAMMWMLALGPVQLLFHEGANLDTTSMHKRLHAQEVSQVCIGPVFPSWPDVSNYWTCSFSSVVLMLCAVAFL